MADTSVTTGKNKWIWWLVSLLGLGAIGTGLWYFFFRKESTFAQNRLKAKNAANGTNNGTSQQETTTQQETTNTQPQTQPQTEPQTQPQTNQVNPPPKTEKPKDNAPKVYGDVYNDIFVKYRGLSISSAPKNAKALVQYLINDLIGNYSVDLPKLVVDGDFGKKSTTAFNAVMNKIYKKTGVSYPPASYTVGMFVSKYAGTKNVLLDATESDIKDLMGKVDAKKVFK